MGRVMKTEKGFSLLELLIVVAIILIIATIAIPSLLRSRQAANESHAVANLRTLNTAEVQYISSHQVYGDIPNLITSGLLDSRYNRSLVRDHAELLQSRFPLPGRRALELLGAGVAPGGSSLILL